MTLWGSVEVVGTKADSAADLLKLLILRGTNPYVLHPALQQRCAGRRASSRNNSQIISHERSARVPTLGVTLVRWLLLATDPGAGTGVARHQGGAACAGCGSDRLRQ